MPPNVKKLDRPPTKKPRGTQAAPEIHIAINITPTPGVGGPAMQGSYVVSETPIEQSGSACAQGPLGPAQVSDIAVHTKTCSAPAPTPAGHRTHSPLTRSPLIQSLDCYFGNRVPLAHELLSTMDIEVPAPDLKYINALSNLLEFGYEDAVDIHGLRACHLASFGSLGGDGARRVLQFARDRYLIPLGLMETKRSSEVPSIEEIADPTVQVIGQRDDEDEGPAMKEEEKETITDWLARVVPGEIEVNYESTDVEDEIEEDEIEEDDK